MFPLVDFCRTQNYMVISCFCDESGKFRDKRVTVFAGLALLEDHAADFEREWRRNLYRVGLEVLSMKEAGRYNRPLSPRVDAIGLENRIEALMPFVELVRRHFEVIVTTATNTDDFNSAPDHVRAILGPNPHY